jgi:PAS domain S-box-containing protein
MKPSPSNASATNEDIFKIFVERSVDGLLVIDWDGIVRYANPSAITMFADKTSELVGAFVGVPATRRASEIVLPRADGFLYIEMVATEIEWEGRSASLASLRDFTARNRLEDERNEALSKFRGLVEQSISGIVIIMDGKLAYANPRFAEIVDQGSAVDLIGADPLQWIAEADRGEFAAVVQKLLDGGAPRVTVEFGVLRRDGVSIQVGANFARATHEGHSAIIGLMQDISERKRAEKQIKDYVDQLEKAVMSTVEVATRLSEMRDPYTAGHERRVAEIAVAISAELGFDAHRQEGLRVAGHLHDVGKINIPTEILSKPGKISAIEFQLIQDHAQAGHDVLKNVPFPWPVAQVALQHHERMDGSGYPQGLKGEAILLEARIIAVADVVEAMFSHRPYRAGLGIDKALAEIERGRGTAYDPNVVDACLRLFREKHYQLQN